MNEPLRVFVAGTPMASANNIAQIVGQINPLYCVVGITQDGTKALRQVERFKPDAVILDFGLPNLGDLAFYTALKATHPEIGMVVICSKADMPVIDEAFPPRQVDYLLKPVNPFDLLMILERLAHRQPDDKMRNAIVTPYEFTEIISNVQTYLKAHCDKKICFSGIAAQYSFSITELTQIFIERIGATPQEYLHQYRIEYAKRLLAGTKLSVMEVGARVGYPDPSRFSLVFKQNERVSPTEFRKAYR